MGFLKWIKREIDTPNSCKRRQSAPPISMAPLNSNTLYPRDEAYIKALSKFNEWRHKHKIGSLGRSSKKEKERRRFNKETQVNSQNNVTRSTNQSADSSQTSIDQNLKNIYEEIEFSYVSQGSLNSSISFCANYQDKNTKNRHEIKTKVDTHGSKSLGAKPESKIVTMIYENDIQNFEKDFCSHGVQTNSNHDDINTISSVLSPPVKFYKKNSCPYDDDDGIKLSKDYIDKYSATYSTLTKQNVKKQEIPKKPKRNFERPKTTIDPIACSTKPSHSKTYTKFDAHISLPSDLDISYVKDNEKTSKNKYCQKIINKHGDEIEYALPLSQSAEYLNDGNKFNSIDLNETRNKIQRAIEESFDFLDQTEQNLSLEDSFEQINSFPHTKDVIVTDLDQSEGDSKIFNNAQVDEDIINELQTLEKWSQSLNLVPVYTSISKNRSSPYKKRHWLGDLAKQMNLSGIYSCTLKDLQPRTSQFRNSIICPIIYRSGMFRTIPVSLFLFDRTTKKDAEFALQKNYLIMKKLRHPNVALLMAICLDKSNEIVSLILEPFENTLHDVLHKNNLELPLNECLDYTLQIINALKYMHECKLVHSNISSHAILVGEQRKLIKLSAFELTINTNYEFKNPYSLYENESRIDGTKISKEHLPHWIEYRKIYSQHYYQSPELISTKVQFVYPTIKSDIYGLSLLLWEMLNNHIPYELLNYNDLESLHRLNQIKLPYLNADRCKIFENILKQGLRINPEQRFVNTDTMKAYLEEIKTNNLTPSPESLKQFTSPLKSNEKKSPYHESDSLLNFSKLLKTRNFGLDTYDRTSTLKKRKQKIERNNNLQAKGLFYDEPQNTEKIEISPVHHQQQQQQQQQKEIKKTIATETNFHNDSGIASNYVNVHRTQEIQSEDNYVSDTPIARKNKLLKEAWLSKNFTSQEQSSLANENNVKIMDKLIKHDISNANSPGKTLNVSIRITQNVAKEKPSSIENTEMKTLETEKSNNSPTNITSLSLSKTDVAEQIKYWNNLSVCQEITFNTKKGKLHENHAISQIIPKKNSFDCNEIEKNDKNHVQNSLASTIDCNKESFEEFFNRPRLNDDDFENTLWHKEKQKCEQNSKMKITKVDDDEETEAGVITPRRISVKESIFKFESLLRCRACCAGTVLNFDNSKRENELSMNDPNAARLIESKEIIDSVEISNVSEIETTTQEEPQEKDNLHVSKLDIILQNSSEQKSSQSHAEIESIDNTVKEIESPKKLQTSSQSVLLSLNLKKLSRHSSDVGYNGANIFTANKATSHKISSTNVRHSISGIDEIFKRLGQVSFVNIEKLDVETKDKQSEYDLTAIKRSSATELRIGKLKCWNCGCQVFAVNGAKEITQIPATINTPTTTTTTVASASSVTETEKENLQQHARDSIASARQSIDGISQGVAKSVEDLYIDDDFTNNELGKLCANIELGIDDDSKLSDVLDFDILSAEILSKLDLSS